MVIKQLKSLNPWLVALISFFLSFAAAADEKIIQQKQISFEKCLKVIKTSQNKLLIDPKIMDISTQERVAVFKLVDGTLTITCDGKKGKVTVSTNAN